MARCVIKIEKYLKISSITKLRKMTNKCEKCNKEFATEEALKHHHNSKHYVESKKPFLSSKRKKQIKIYGVVAIILIVLIFFVMSLSAVKSLPPTTMKGHIEVIPKTVILKEPIKPEIHKHILEHFDGGDGNRGGVVINYDCKNYDCSPDLIEKLEAFTEEYGHVYVAPFKNMKVKIAITKLNQIRKLDSYDEDAIRQFIGIRGI